MKQACLCSWVMAHRCVLPSDRTVAVLHTVRDFLIVRGNSSCFVSRDDEFANSLKFWCDLMQHQCVKANLWTRLIKNYKYIATSTFSCVLFAEGMTLYQRTNRKDCFFFFFLSCSCKQNKNVYWFFISGQLSKPPERPSRRSEGSSKYQYLNIEWKPSIHSFPLLYHTVVQSVIHINILVCHHSDHVSV